MKTLTTSKLGQQDILKRLRAQRSKSEDVNAVVSVILQNVKKRGDKALLELTQRFDGLSLKSLAVTEEEIRQARASVPKSIIAALKRAKRNIARFHKTTMRKKEPVVETEKGVRVWREFRPIEKVGLYVPGGKAAYPSTVLMLAVPAKIAGCKEIVMCTPAGRDGKCNPTVLATANMCGIKKIFRLGGAQAIAGMAYGTESVPRVYKIFGPGNQYVTTAKMLVYGEVDIDMPAGPSEVAIIADETANPAWIAADLLSQLEHGEDSQAVLVTTSENLAQKVILEAQRQIAELSRREIAEQSLEKSFVIAVKNTEEACEIVNEYAPEHLEIVAKNPAKILRQINNVGSVFLGKYASEPLGDYATGANHTLPTSGFAKMFPPLSTDSFGKMIQVQKVSLKGFENLSKTVTTLADSEGLDGHAKAVTIRY